MRSHSKFHVFPLSLTILATALAAAPALARPLLTQDQNSSAAAPDNSAHNKQQDTTADKQSNAAGDRETARQIRKSVIADKTLSTYAHNVKIIVVNGTVTLKGPVRSEDEKKRIGDLAAQVAGSPDKVTNDISVKAASQDRP